MWQKKDLWLHAFKYELKQVNKNTATKDDSSFEVAISLANMMASIKMEKEKAMEIISEMMVQNEESKENYMVIKMVAGKIFDAVKKAENDDKNI